MRTALLVLASLVPVAACSDGAVTAPPAVVPAPATVPALTGIMVDGVVVVGGNINPLDIEQVEIIKGPAAATLYGTETRCPAIIIRTNRPSPTPLPPR